MNPDQENIAATLARVLPTPSILSTSLDFRGMPAQEHFAMPEGFTLKTVELEGLRSGPRRAKGVATMGDSAGFLAYVAQHKNAGTTVWCAFNPTSFDLTFRAVIDEHEPGTPGWRDHTAVFTPSLSVEWKTWLTQNGGSTGKGAMEQATFAEFLERNENDIASVEGMPTSLDMHKMATDFVMRSEKAFKSALRLQDGSVRLTYVDDADAATVDAMRMFEKFTIGIPVFWSVPGTDIAGKALPVDAFPIVARLKYRQVQGKVSFWYELIRPDRVHQQAALGLIEKIRAGLGSVPLRMGDFS